MSFKTVFNIDWLDEKLYPEFASWVQIVENDPYKFRCRLCRKAYSLSNMGKQALTSHSKYDKHKKILKNYQVNRVKFLSCEEKKKDINNTAAVSNDNSSNNEEVTEIKNEVAEKRNSETTNSIIGTKKDCPILKFVDKEDVLKAEIVWAMKLVMSHSSFNSFKDAAEIFKIMFPDSEISKKVTLSSSKMAYVIAFGLSPFFYKELLQNIGKDVKFVLCIDEALNTVAQSNQMDMIIRYWPESSSEIQVRYLNSIFLGHSTAQDLYTKFIEGSVDLNLSNLLQISLDGPNVNLKFLRTIMGELKESKGHLLIDIGTCSLHIIHNAFQRGNKITKWKLNEILSAMYRMFKDSPARRADFISSTQSNVFPLKFCRIRWVENVKVAERALEVFPNVKKYFEEHKSNLPHNISIGNIENACCDKLLLCKISFFNSVASMLEPFLKLFQPSKPMVPYMYDSVSDILRKVMLRFIKREIISEAQTPSKLLDIKVKLKSNHLRVQDMDIE